MNRQRRDRGFSMIEMTLVLAVTGVIAAMAIPSAVRQVAVYKLNADAVAVSSWLNVARMKAASQFAPFRLNVYIDSGSYVLEQLCGGNTSDSACTASGATSYTSYSSPSYDKSGTQYISSGNKFSSCRPSGITAFPGTITADPSPCPNPGVIYFNTRGAPVDSSGNSITASGGTAIYLQNATKFTDAVVVTLGGQVSVWTYSPASSTWSLR